MTGIHRSFAAVASVAALLAVALVTGVAAGPAAAGGGAPPIVNPPGGGGSAGGSSGGSSGGGSSGGGTYTADVAASVSLSGDANPGYNESWAPPECWLQPDFRQPQTWAPGDPTLAPSDAASFYFWFGYHYPSFAGLLTHMPGARQQILAEFQQEQRKQRPAAWGGPDPITSSDVWWVPNWLDSPSGWACVQGMLATDSLSDGFLGMEPPVTPGAGGGGGGRITSTQLAELARAALRLPALKIVTSPPVSTVVNLPTYVSVEYPNGVINPSDTATVNLAGLPFLSATVQATLWNVQISSNAPSYATAGAGGLKQPCAAVNGHATSACTITFGAPSGATPYTITVSVTWKVSWTTNVGAGGRFGSTPPVTQTATIVVREIQSQT